MNHSFTHRNGKEQIIATNFTGTFLLPRTRAPHAAPATGVSSASHRGRAAETEGEASTPPQSRRDFLTQILAREFADFGITVSAIGPTPSKTDLIRGVSPEKQA
jgi:3-oxoacyl-[acyl-carrier protein] reductase